MILKIDDATSGLQSDRRFKSWAKLIHSSEEINLAATGGNALGGTFVNWGKTIAYEPDQFVIFAAESGSAKYHDYKYTLYGNLTEDPGEAPECGLFADEVVDQLVQDSDLPDDVKAKAANSRLYAYAAFVVAETQRINGAQAPVDALSDAALRVLDALASVQESELPTLLRQINAQYS